MDTLVVTIPTALKDRLETLASQTGQGMHDCLVLAMQEFVENWEIHIKDLRQIDEREARTVLKAANE